MPSKLVTPSLNSEKLAAEMKYRKKPIADNNTPETFKDCICQKTTVSNTIFCCRTASSQDIRRTKQDRIFSEIHTWLPQGSWLCVFSGLPVAAVPRVCLGWSLAQAVLWIVPSRFGKLRLGTRQESAGEQEHSQANCWPAWPVPEPVAWTCFKGEHRWAHGDPCSVTALGSAEPEHHQYNNWVLMTHGKAS